MTQANLIQAAKGLVAFASRQPAPPPLPEDAPRLGVYLLPWYMTPVPFFSAILGIAVASRGSHKVDFLVCDECYPSDQDGMQNHNGLVVIAAKSLSRFGHVIKLSSLIADRQQHEEIALSHQNVMYDILHRVGFGAMPWPAKDFYEFAASRGARILSGVRHYLERNKPEAVLLPGGVVNTTYGFRKLCDARGIRVATYDSGAGTPRNYVCGFGVAAQGWEIPPTVKDILARNNPAEINRCRNLARDYADLVATGRDDIFALPFEQAGAEHIYDIVIVMSMEQDSTLLSAETLFRSQKDWLAATIAMARKDFPQARIAVRQHPDERRCASHLSDKTIQYLKELGLPPGQLTIFDKHDNISTHDLMRRAKLVLCMGSTAGLDAAMIGRKVISQARIYFAGSSFCAFPDTQEDYCSAIAAHLSDPRPLPESAVIEADLFFYVRSFCWRVETLPTPDPPLFLEWINRATSFADTSPPFSDMLSAICGEANFCSQRHAVNLKDPELFPQ